MGWIEWAIPLVAVAVWILSSLAKNQQEQVRRNVIRPPVPPPIDPDKADRGRRSTAERVDPRGDPVEETKLRRPAVKPPSRPVPILERARPVRRPSPVPRRDPAPVPIAEIVVEQPPPNVENVAPKVSSRPLSAAILNIHGTLKNRQSLATALLLREILGPPRSRTLQRYHPPHI